MARGSKVWFNGKFIPAEDAKISLFTHALHYGTGAFEGIRAYRQNKGGGAIFRLREHMERLHNSSKILGLSLPFSVDQLCEAAVEACRQNQYEECYIRPIAYVGDGPLGVSVGKNPPVDIALLTWEWGKYLGDDAVQNGTRLKISSFNRPQPNSVMTKGKISGQYVTGVLAKQEAIACGYDEALLLDPEGYLAEGSGENLFMISNGVVKTTPLNSILGGITRSTVIEHLRHQGLTVEEIRFTRDELWGANEAFVCGTAAEVTPIRSVDDRDIGKGKPGEITLKLQREYQAMVRGDLPPYGKNWLTPI